MKTIQLSPFCRLSASVRDARKFSPDKHNDEVTFAYLQSVEEVLNSAEALLDILRQTAREGMRKTHEVS